MQQWWFPLPTHGMSPAFTALHGLHDLVPPPPPLPAPGLGVAGKMPLSARTEGRRPSSAHNGMPNSSGYFTVATFANDGAALLPPPVAPALAKVAAAPPSANSPTAAAAAAAAAPLLPATLPSSALLPDRGITWMGSALKGVSWVANWELAHRICYSSYCLSNCGLL